MRYAATIALLLGLWWANSPAVVHPKVRVEIWHDEYESPRINGQLLYDIDNHNSTVRQVIRLGAKGRPYWVDLDPPEEE